MHKVLRVFAMEWSTMLQYRVDLFLWTLTESAVPLIALAIWYTIARSGSFVLSPTETVTYFVLTIFTSIITTAWNGFFFAREILTGEITPYLARPLSIVWKHFANNIVEKTIKLLIPVPVLLAVFWFFPRFFSPEIYTLAHIGFYFFSTVLGLAIAFMFDMALGSIAFWLEDALEIRRFKDLLYEIGAGILIPFAAMPAIAVSFFSLLPFRYILAVPIEILMGQIEGARLLLYLSLQAVWLLGLSVLFAFMWRAGLKRYAVPTQ